MATESMRRAAARDDAEIARIANRLRRDVVEMLTAAGSGHPGGSLSAADILATLFYSGEFAFDPADPKNPARDRFVLSKGHAAPVLYALMAQIGYLPHEELLTLRQMGTRLQGHPDSHLCPGVEVCSGSLGQGLSIAAGMALGFKLDAAHEGAELRRVFAITGDGELQEGQNWEAAMFAGNHGLDNLVLFLDLNNLQIDGHVSDVNSIAPIQDKFRAFGWHVIDADGHDVASLRAAIAQAVAHTGSPVAIACSTVKGKGVSFMEDRCSWHGVAPTAEECERALAELDAAYEKLVNGTEA